MATTTATVRMPAATKRRLASVARQRGLTLSRYLIESAERDASSEPAPLPVSPVALEIMRFVRPENTIPGDL
ncbi:MAG: hypothetical protein HY302_05175 [Opitutae bacterium]|nr:hypothetical protein [Opitutae bacterium]